MITGVNLRMPARRTALPALLLTATALLAVPASPALAAPPSRPDPGSAALGEAYGPGGERPDRTDAAAPRDHDGSSETPAPAQSGGRRHDPGPHSGGPQDHRVHGMPDPPAPPTGPPPDRTPASGVLPPLRPGTPAAPTGPPPAPHPETASRQPAPSTSPSAPPSPAPRSPEHRRDPARSLPAAHAETAYRAAPDTPREEAAVPGSAEEDAVADDAVEAGEAGETTEQRALARSQGRSPHVLPLGGGLIMVGLGLGLVFLALRVRRI
ncbi:hypothetical protein [Streptomyces koyangensis]|uniref:Tat pathway signal sequence domain protein n=1 Tax=Streptomyces koyangensis TaxID=188770 RepID=A0A385DCD2_9ACTN|nr:hypothetical protein [Streptomyces koyangensis]AXQ55996.1 hypothetical protein D0C37_16165 [Streptomyces koyangensis]